MEKENILIACVGITDPIRSDYDGPILHITRYYHPKKIYMILSSEIAERERKWKYSPESAILSAIIFNAIIIPILIPLALKGVQYKPIGASALLRRNLLIYGLGGVIAPFIGIKLIDMIVSLFFQ